MTNYALRMNYNQVSFDLPNKRLATIASKECAHCIFIHAEWLFVAIFGGQCPKQLAREREGCGCMLLCRYGD